MFILLLDLVWIFFYLVFFPLLDCLFYLNGKIPFLLLLQNAKYLPNYPSENVGRIYTVKQMDEYWKEIIE